MMPGPYHGPPTPMMHHNRRQNQGEFYHHPGYYPQQQQYHNQHAPPYPQQWYPPPAQYAMQQAYNRPYQPMPHQVPPLPPPQHGPLIVSSHPQPSPMPFQPRHSVHSSVVATPVQVAPSTPSVHSQVLESPATPTTSVSASAFTPPPSATSHPVASASTPQPAMQRMPFYPELPWYSEPEEPFPPRAARRRRKARHNAQTDGSLELPSRTESGDSGDVIETLEAEQTTQEYRESRASTIAGPSDLETPSTSQAPSETDSTQPTTPSSALPTSSDSRSTLSPTTARFPVRPAVPIIPVAPKLSPSSQKSPQPVATSTTQKQDAIETAPPILNGEQHISPTDQPKETDSAPAPTPAPKSWADLVRSKNPPPTPVQQTNGNGVQNKDTFGTSKSAPLAEAIRSFSVNSDAKISFLEPRGLVNTGNMCYMNSILQVLVFCIPCYDFLDQVGKRAAHSFKSDTPLLDAMIMFMREFKVIDSAESVEKLRMRLKDNELEQYGDAFIPEYVYDVIKRLPRFSSMRRGHQQDAEEFLGFLLEGLHDECAQVLKSLPENGDSSGATSPVSERATPAEAGWHEVGPKQKAAITRSTGHIVTDSPVTKIFGGKLRSELRVPGLKNSVTLEPYQPLQLDIGAPNVNNIVDALKGLTRSETLHGDFNSPRGPGTTATKQVFIETLPPVLILHLKRFQYDNTGGTQKIWKKVGYPLELTIPKEVFPLHRRNGLAISGMPKYRLSAVVYHHGKNASGGHYTVDVRRQEGTEWIRLDDTVIRRVRSDDVAEAGAEEDPKVLAKALEQHKRDPSSAGGKNIFEQFEDAEDHAEESSGGWNQVNGSAGATSARKWNAVANGATTPSTAGRRTPPKESSRDNKVAYILFYRKIE